MITHEARAEVSNGIDGVIEISAAGLMPSDSWERPDALVSTAKQDVHDRFFLDTPDGKWLSAGRIAHEVHEVTSAFVGETSLGRQVFLVAPGERARPINQKNIPLDTHFAFTHALEREFLQAVRTAEDQHLITHEEATRQAGGVDPQKALDALEASYHASVDARASWKFSRNQNTPHPEKEPQSGKGQDMLRDGTMAMAQATNVALPMGIMGASIDLTASRKDGHGRRFRKVGKLMYMTSAGITVGSLVLSACTSVQSLPPQEVVVATQMPEQFSPTVDQAKQAVASWMGIRIPLAEGEFGIFPTQAIFEVDPTDSTGQTLKTLSLLNPDGRTTDPDLRYAMGLALVPSEKTGETVDLPFMVQLGKNGEALMLGMFLDPAQSTKEVGVFRLNIVKDGQISPVTQEVVVTKVAGGVTIALRDISDPKNIVTYHLVSTPKDASIPPQQSAVATEIVGNNWIEKVVAFMSGAGNVQAAEPATPEELASATTLPSETPPPTATPAETVGQTNSLIYGCKDETKTQQVLSDFRAVHPGFDFNSIKASKVDFFISGGEWITVNHDGILVGEYIVDLSGKDVAGYRAGANSYARCMVVMIPGINDPISIIDRLFVDGQKMNVLLVGHKLVDDEKVDNFINSNIGKVIRFNIEVADKYAQKPATQPPYSSINLDWYNNLFTQLGSIGPINSPVDEKLVKNLLEFYNNSGGLLVRELTVAK